MSKLTDNAIKVLEKRYLMKDKDGKVIETPSDLFRRVAKAVAQAEYNYLPEIIKESNIEIGGEVKPPLQEIVNNTIVNKIEEAFYKMMMDLDFLPNTPTLMNAGRPLGNLNACFCLPILNDYREILRTVKNTALIHKSGGGTGFNFSKIKLPAFYKEGYKPMFVLDSSHKDVDLLKNETFHNAQVLSINETVLNKIIENNPNYKVIYLEDTMDSIFNLESLLDKPDIIVFSNIRPHNARVNTTGGEATGPVSFMKVWDETIRFLSKDISPIPTIKLLNSTTGVISQGGVRRGANMGVLNIDCEYVEEFITCKQDNEDITNFNLSVGIVNGFFGNIKVLGLKDYTTGKIVRLIDYDKLFDKITQNAWKNGEPGIIFLDKINELNPIHEEIEATNPCGKYMFAT